MSRDTWRTRAVSTLLNPHSVAVVGAKPEDPIGGSILRMLAFSDIPGGVFGVSRREVTDQPFPFVSSLEDLPHAPDVVLAAVGSKHVPDVVASAAKLGVKAVIAFDGGFADIGEEGMERQRLITSLADEAEMALVGPNCYGVANLADKIALYAQDVDFSQAGSFALISNSGGVTDQIVGDIDRGVQWGFVVATGNEASLTSADFLSALVEREDCAGICLFVETIRDPRLFFEACDRARELHKPVIVLRVGISERARDAAAAHTGALAPPAQLFDAKLKHHGVVVVDSIRELLTTAALFQTGKRPKKGVALVAVSGGMLELFHDAAPEATLTYPSFTAETVASLEDCLGPYIRKSNPLDWYPSSEQGVQRAVEAIGQDPNFDTVVVVTQYNYEGPTGSTEYSGGGTSLESARLLQHAERLVVLPDPLATTPAAVERARSYGAVATAGFSETLRALQHLYDFAGRPEASPPGFAQESSVDIEHIPCSGQAAMDLLGRYAAVAVSETVESVADAVRAADRCGYPVVAKLGAEDVQHKSDIGGVRLGLTSATEVSAAATELLDLGMGPVLVQAQAPKGIEIIAGIHTHEDLGDFLIVGAGGIWTEILKDAQIAVLGASRDTIRKMLMGLQVWPLLQGARGEKAVDLEALIDVIVGVDRLGRDLHGRIESLDVNPIIATPEGAVAVDIAIFPRESQ